MSSLQLREGRIQVKQPEIAAGSRIEAASATHPFYTILCAIVFLSAVLVVWRPQDRYAVRTEWEFV